ncbi:MAG: ABC transporter permease [Proteobacteria bacterium]|nr:ABC transporter permease [Pseudomonadota bacterium]
MSERRRAHEHHLSMATYMALAARNLTRNSRRTALTLAALVVAIGALTFLMGFMNAYLVGMNENFVLVMNGHIQIYGPEFKDSNLIDDYMPDTAPITAALDGDDRVRAWTQRITASGLASVARSTTSVAVVGVDPLREPEVGRLRTFVVAGEWLAPEDAGGVLLGVDIADNLEVELGDKIVMMTQGPGGDIVSEAFRVRGLLHSGIPDIDRVLALVTLSSAQSWLGLGDGATEIVVRTHEFETVDAVADALVAGVGQSLDIRRWYNQDPLIEQMLEMQDASHLIIIAVVISVVLGQLINTMFMSLYDRVREFGLMEALGSRRRNLFAMLLWESILLVSIGGFIGYAIAYGAILWTAAVGIDLSAFGDTLASMYIDPIIRPVIDLQSNLYLLGTIIVTAILAGLLPAWRATRLNPVEAMRQI